MKSALRSNASRARQDSSCGACRSDASWLGRRIPDPSRARDRRTGIRSDRAVTIAPPRRRQRCRPATGEWNAMCRSDPAGSLEIFSSWCSRPSAQSCRRARTRPAQSTRVLKPWRNVTSTSSADTRRSRPHSSAIIGSTANLDDVSAAGRARTLAWVKELLGQLQAIERSQLSRANQVDAAMLENQLRYSIWTEEKFRDWSWDPLIYTQLAGQSIYGLLAREFAPLPETAALRDGTARADAAAARADAREPRSGTRAGDPCRNCRASRIPAC